MHIAFLDDVSASAVGGGPIIVEADGASTGLATDTVLAATIWNVLYTSIGLAAGSVIGSALWNTVSFATGLAADSIIGAALWLAEYLTTGLAAVSANSLVTLQCEGIASGLTVDAVVGTAIWNSVHTASGIADDSVVALTLVNSAFSASGLTIASGKSDISIPGNLVSLRHPNGRPYWSLKSKRHPTVFGFPSNTDWIK